MIGGYLVGVPGAGKSTLMRALTAPWQAEWRRQPVTHALYADADRIVAAQIGGPHPDYPGTDRLSMAVQPVAIDWLASAPAPLVLGEGDRLATDGFLSALNTHCERWSLLWLDADPEIAEARRAARGSNQSAAWLRGRATKVARLVDRWAPRVVRIDATWPADQALAVARAALR